MYKRLRDWHTEHGSALSIVLYPSDEFGRQELPEKDIPAFVSKYLPLDDDNVLLMAKVEVNGDDAEPVWQSLKQSFPGDVTWNFNAIFVLDQEGIPVGRYTGRQLDRVDADLRYLVTQSGWS